MNLTIFVFNVFHFVFYYFLKYDREIKSFICYLSIWWRVVEN